MLSVFLKNIVLDIPLKFREYVATEAPLATFKKYLTQRAKGGRTGPGPSQSLWLP